ncbi:phage holin family protein [Falsiroseomonas sp.]|uniref:phage holin family protein n=1 Tax=Falsiroseomonas sp. TaxID=2870721 RepID=UPI0027231B2F|nr:phage holin family protein [Falsiroseomonas sp.]MDO9500018.1 phage holin family protein [Falsiroseomonas sp.]MDP3414879.1 phage holin family protein [Falsiroseomonas sp.]
MRLLSLARAAWQAEGLYLRRSGRGYAIQAGLGAVAAVFALLMLVMLHIAAFAALLPSQGPVWSALIIAFGDLVLAAIMGLLARKPPRDTVAEEALALRQAALRQMGDTATQAMILAPLLRSQTLKKGAIGAAITAAIVGFMNRR